MKCDRCSLQSDVEQAFSTEKGFLGKPRHFCPDCTVKRKARSFLRDLVIIVGCGLFIYALSPSSSTAKAIVLHTSLILLFLIPLIVIHELTHAGVAKLVGLRVFGIMIGIGKTVWSGKRFGTDWTINLLPLGGITLVGTRPVALIRPKLFLIYLAGPASHIFMAAGFFLWQQTLAISTFGYQVLMSLVLANIVLAVTNLFPFKVSLTTGMQGTDGWHLLRVPFLNQAELTKYYISYFAGEALQAYTANDLDAARKWVDQAFSFDGNSGIARNILGIIQMAAGEHQASRETFLQILETDEAKEPGLHYILFNNVAYLDALLRDPALLPEADDYSAQAFQHLPWVPAVIGTRGTVLVELGQFEAGIGLLKKSMSLNVDKQGKALNACHIAVGELRRGNPSAARKFLATAKTLDPTCFLVPYVESLMMSEDVVLSNENMAQVSNPSTP
jgi:tetratricopeptide (TPR) repeat protein